MNGKPLGWWIATEGKDKAEKLWKQANLKITSNDRATSGLANGFFPITKKGVKDLDITSKPKGTISTANSGVGLINAISNLNPNANSIEQAKLLKKQGYQVKRDNTYGPAGANLTIGNALKKQNPPKPQSNNNNQGSNKNPQNQNRSSNNNNTTNPGNNQNKDNKDKNKDKKDKRR